MTERLECHHGTRSDQALTNGQEGGQDNTWLWRLETVLLLIAPIGIWHIKIRPVLALLIFLIAIANHDYRRIDRRILISTAAYLLLMSALSALSVSPATAVKGALSFCSGFLMLLPGITIGRRLRSDGIRLQALIPTSMLLVAYFLSPAVYEGRLFFGLRGNPNGTGYSLLFTLLVLGLALASQFIARDRNSGGSLTRVLLLINLVAVTVLLLFSNHRAGWLAAICFAAFLLASRFASSRALQIVAYLTAAGLFTAFIVVFDRKELLATVDSLGVRLSMWTTAIQTTAANHPMAGHGYNTLREIFGAHEYKDIVRTYNHPHNIFVELFFSTGFLGLGLTLSYILSQIRLTRLMRVDLHNPIAMASLGAIVALLIAFSFGRSIASFEVTGSLSCLYGILLAQSTLPDPNRRQTVAAGGMERTRNTTES